MIAPLLAFLSVAGSCYAFFAPATEPKWYVASLIVPLAFLLRDRRPFPGDLPGIAFLAWSALSILWAMSWPDALQTWWHWALLAGMVVLGAGCDLRRCVQAYGAGLAIGLIFVWAQYRGYEWAPEFAAQAGEYPGLLFNSNYAAEASALGLVAAVAFRQWWIVPLALLGLAANPSRGAGLMIFAALAFWVWQKNRKAGVALTILVIATTVGHVAWLGLDSGLIAGRLSLWVNSLTLIDFTGYGIGSFYHAFPLANDALIPTREEVFRFGVYPNTAHNDFLTLAVEVGLIGLAFFLWFLLILVRQPGPGRYLIIAGMADALVNFPLHVPSTAFLLALAAGHVLGSWRIVRSERGHVRVGVPQRIP